MRDVLEDKRGVCQDFAHVMIGLCRSVKIPALYVSGYLATETASATHAWMEVFIPGHRLARAGPDAQPSDGRNLREDRRRTRLRRRAAGERQLSRHARTHDGSRSENQRSSLKQRGNGLVTGNSGK